MEIKQPMTQRHSERPLWFWPLVAFLGMITGFSLIGGAFVVFYSLNKDHELPQRKIERHSGVNEELAKLGGSMPARSLSKPVIKSSTGTRPNEETKSQLRSVPRFDSGNPLQGASVQTKTVASLDNATVNPVDIVRQAGATPKQGSAKGDMSYDGEFWFASGNFPALNPQDAQAGSFTQLTVNVFSSRQALERGLASYPSAITTDANRVLVSKDKAFYAIITGRIDGSFDVDPADIASRINAYLKP
jgi:hypothetical protein